MKEWRPYDWKNPYPDEPREHMRGGIHTAYEAGASAMLKALKPLILEIAPSSKLIDVLYKKDQVVCQD